MKNKRKQNQEDLFGLSELEALKRQIKEMDQQISRALKSNNYTKAKELTERQAQLLQAMLENGDQ